MADLTSRAPFTMIPNWVIRNGILDPHELTIYLVLLSHRDHTTGLAWPGLGTIARESRMSRSKVIRTLPHLTDRGLITIARRPRGNGSNDSNLYKVGEFNRQQPRDNSQASKGPRFQDASESPIPNGWETPPSVSQPLGGGDSQLPEEEPPTRRPIEEDVRFKLAFEHKISFKVHDSAATTRQIEYLQELYIHYNNEIPPQGKKDAWKKHTQAEASTLIDTYLSQMPRYDEYQGPEDGEETYSVLSPQGQQWADTGFIPEERRTS